MFRVTWPELIPETEYGVWPRNWAGMLRWRMPLDRVLMKIIWAGLAALVVKLVRST